MGLFFLYRRRQRARQARDAAVEPKQDLPAPAEAVLNRPDPIEKPQLSPQLPPPSPTTPTNNVRLYSSTGNSVVDLDPRSRSQASLPSARRASGRQSPGNPFEDGHSIQTTSTTTNGTNVIPIALVSPPSAPLSPAQSESGSFTSNSPVRPARPSELVLDSPQHQAEPQLDAPSPHYAHSQRSELSRNSYASNASYSSDFLNEAPMIVTHTQGAVRQVVGKVRAEVIQTSGAATPTSHLSTDSLKPPSVVSRPSVRSPLAATSFGPEDIVNETEEDPDISARSDPFGDHHAPANQVTSDSRVEPGSAEPVLSARLGPVVNDGATRVTIDPDQKSPHSNLTTRLIPPSATLSGTLQEQQQRALAHAQAQARAQGFDKAKRMSGTSMVSTTSTRADSILESFPFVPPSPISSRPVRSPPRSPLGQQSIAATQLQTSLAVPAASLPLSLEEGITDAEASLPPLSPPSRRILGMSTGSNLSTASSGLGNFPFQIDHGGTEASQTPPSTSQGRQRASLDTLALMSDLTSYPLGYDRDDHGVPPLPKS
ncbi:hypothetical protein JVU11DRAFT_1869 [Chiua virens]|nr:hypothetical protein JVU11DRAFT_1869 [Chiua virens]